MSKKKIDMQQDDFENKDENLQIGFYLNNVDEKKKLKELAKHNGLGVSALLRMLVLKTWRKEVKNDK